MALCRFSVPLLLRPQNGTVGLLVERVDAAEIRAEAAEDRADRVEQRLGQILDVLLSERKPSGEREREPWWRRWFGHSTRSKLGGAE